MLALWNKSGRAIDSNGGDGVVVVVGWLVEEVVVVKAEEIEEVVVASGIKIKSRQQAR